MKKLKIQTQLEKRSLTGDSDKDSRGSSNNGDHPRPEAPQGATGQNPNSPETSETPASRGERLLSGIENPGNLEALTEKVGTLGLQGEKKNRSGAAKKRSRRARLAEAPYRGLYRRPASASRRQKTDFSGAQFFRAPR
jgi:hypothetical protein